MNKSIKNTIIKISILPICWIIVLSILNWSSKFLKLPNFAYDVTNFVYSIILFIIFNSLALKIIDIWANRLTSSKHIAQTHAIFYFIPTLKRILKISIVCFAGIFLLKSIGYNVTSLMAGVGITGLAVGFAAKETIADVFGSFTIIADKIFKVGDIIIINEPIAGIDTQGTVEDISLLSTKIRTIDNSLVTIPNYRIASMTIKNLSERKKLLFEGTLGLNYETTTENLEHAIKICKDILNSRELIEQNALVHFQSFSESTLDIFFRAYINTTDWSTFLDEKQAILFEIKKKFEENSLDFAFKTQTIYLKQ